MVSQAVLVVSGCLACTEAREHIIWLTRGSTAIAAIETSN